MHNQQPQINEWIVKICMSHRVESSRVKEAGNSTFESGKMDFNTPELHANDKWAFQKKHQEYTTKKPLNDIKKRNRRKMPAKFSHGMKLALSLQLHCTHIEKEEQTTNK